MSSLIERIVSQSQSGQGVFYEPVGCPLSPELEKTAVTSYGKGYINHNVSTMAEGQRKHSSNKDSYLYSNARPKGCPVRCKLCINCYLPDCNYNKIN